jgi:hypothetical protein
LSRESDDEDMQPPTSDESNESDEESSEDWSICDFLKEQFGDEQLYNNVFEENILEQNEMPHGLHWDYSANIIATNENKMKPTPTSMKPGSRKLFKMPMDSRWTSSHYFFGRLSLKISISMPTTKLRREWLTKK